MSEEYVIIIGEEGLFIVEARNKLVAWEVAVAQAMLMWHNGELKDDVDIRIITKEEALKGDASPLFIFSLFLADRLDAKEVLEKAGRWWEKYE